MNRENAVRRKEKPDGPWTVYVQVRPPGRDSNKYVNL
jgi:hypothetical protein